LESAVLNNNIQIRPFVSFSLYRTHALGLSCGSSSAAHATHMSWWVNRSAGVKLVSVVAAVVVVMATVAAAVAAVATATDSVGG